MSGSKSSLVNWYRKAVRGLLESVDPKRIESADAECTRLESLEKVFSAEVPVCFLGASGIGKSTLINALVGESLLPHGGIGPSQSPANTNGESSFIWSEDGILPPRTFFPS